MRKILFNTLLVLVAGTGALHGQKFYWAHSAESSNNNTSDIRAIEVTSDGHTIAFGTFNHRLLLDNLVLEETMNGTSFFVAKYDPDGNPVWVNHIQCDEYLSITHNQVGLTLDASDNIYISSVYEGNLHLGEVTVTNTDATSDYFVAKYTKEGALDYAWGQGADDAIAVDIAVDASNNVYVAGHYAGELRFDDPLETVLTSSGSHDAFLARYDDNGTAIWARSSGDADNYDFSYGVELVDTSLYWGINYREGTTLKQYIMSVVKLDTNNAQQWTYEARSTDSGTGYINQANGLKAYGSDLYVAGYFRGGIQPDGEDVPLTHADYQSLTFKIQDVTTSASYQWSTAIGDTSWDYGYTVARQGTSIFSGRYTSPHSYIDELADTNGSLIRSTTSSSKGPSDREHIYDLDVHSSDRLLIAGYFDENISYGENGEWTSQSPALFLCKSDVLIEPDWLSGPIGFTITYKKSIMDQSGNTYVGGTFSGVMKDGEDLIKSRGSNDVLVEKFDASGNLLYRKLAGTSLNDFFGDIAIYDNELYLTGVFDVFDGSEALHIEDQIITGDEDKEVFLARYKASGDLDFAARAGSTEGDLWVQSIGLDSSGNIYLYGDARGGSAKNFGNNVTLAFDETGFFLTKYNSAGHAQWVRSVNDTDDYKMHVSEKHGIYITGKYSIADLNFEGTILPEEGFADIFFANYDYNGDFQWVVGGGGPSTDVINGLAVDEEDGNVFLTGYFHTSLTLSGNTVSGTNRELFAAKYDALGNYQWLVSGGGDRVSDQGKAIALDTAGNVVVVGQYEGDDATFDGYTPGGAGIYEVDALLLHYDADDGSLIQGHHWGHPTNYLEGDDNELFQSVYIDENNDLTITGQFVDEVFLDTIAVPIYSYYSSFVTKMSLSDCAHIGEVDFDQSGNLNVGEIVTFTDQTSLGAHTINGWQWDFGDASTSAEQNPMHSYAAAGDYIITLKVTYNTSCQLALSKTLSVAEKLNTPPVVHTPIQDLELIVGAADHEITLSDHFSDEDGDVLNYESLSEDPAVALVTEDGSVLTISPVTAGNVLITVTADDGQGDEVTDSFFVQVSETPNNAPLVANPLSDMERVQGFLSEVINLGDVFSDEDGDPLDYTCASADESVVTVSVSGSELTITEAAVGTATITVTASDGRGGQATDHFLVIVNETANTAPVVASPLPDMELEEGFTSTILDISGVFSDEDGDALEYTATSADESVVTVSVSGSELTITEAALGTTTITVTASDGRGGQATDHFLVTVNETANTAPVVANPLPDMELEEGFTSTRLDISSIFSDEDGDALEYTTTSSNGSAADVSIDGSELVISETGVGSTVITMRVSDGNEGEAVDHFRVTVHEAVLGGIDDPAISLRIYPNPTSDQVHIEMDGDKIEIVRVLDLSGNILSTHLNSTTVDLQHYQSGVYMLQIITSDNHHFRRVIRE